MSPSSGKNTPTLLGPIDRASLPSPDNRGRQVKGQLGTTEYVFFLPDDRHSSSRNVVF
jgi:hypothetical protein